MVNCFRKYPKVVKIAKVDFNYKHHLVCCDVIQIIVLHAMPMTNSSASAKFKGNREPTRKFNKFISNHGFPAVFWLFQLINYAWEKEFGYFSVSSMAFY